MKPTKFWAIVTGPMMRSPGMLQYDGIPGAPLLFAKKDDAWKAVANYQCGYFTIVRVELRKVERKVYGGK